MECRTLAEGGVQLPRIHAGNPGRIEMAQPTLELRRPAERLLDSDLLVQREADEQREGFLGKQTIRDGVTGERKRDWGGHEDMVANPAYRRLNHPAMKAGSEAGECRRKDQTARANKQGGRVRVDKQAGDRQ